MSWNADRSFGSPQLCLRTHPARRRRALRQVPRNVGPPEIVEGLVLIGLVVAPLSYELHVRYDKSSHAVLRARWCQCIGLRPP